MVDFLPASCCDEENANSCGSVHTCLADIGEDYAGIYTTLHAAAHQQSKQTVTRQHTTVTHQQSGSLDSVVSPAAVLFAKLYVCTAMHASQSSMLLCTVIGKKARHRRTTLTKALKLVSTCYDLHANFMQHVHTRTLMKLPAHKQQCMLLRQSWHEQQMLDVYQRQPVMVDIPDDGGLGCGGLQGRAATFRSNLADHGHLCQQCMPRCRRLCAPSICRCLSVSCGLLGSSKLARADLRSLSWWSRTCHHTNHAICPAGHAVMHEQQT